MARKPLRAEMEEIKVRTAEIFFPFEPSICPMQSLLHAT